MSKELIHKLNRLVPGIAFKPSDSFYWSPGLRSVFFNVNTLSTHEGLWALIHETAHAILNHSEYRSDYELVQMEVDAWRHAEVISKELDIVIDTEHIQDCLDTYRDWLHQRSTCPRCGIVCLQISPKQYACHNCSNSWSVSNSKFCRPYRLNNGFMAINKTADSSSAVL